MIYQIVVLAVFAAFVVNLVLNLRTIRFRGKDCPLPPDPPFVSMLIPARNEERNIARCVNSLRAQDYPTFEVLVLDDNSHDRTADIVSGIAGEDTRVRLLRGAPLPQGWAGKPFACHQLAKEARGDYLLFIDSDTSHAPDMLRTVMPVALTSGASIISGFPRQIVRSIAEQAAVPVIYFLLLSALPLSLPLPYNEPRRSFMIGQFMLFPATEYWRIGGHEAVKSRIMEDLFLGIEMRHNGGRQLTLNLSSVTCCRMYRDSRSLWEGFLKWGYSFACLWPIGTLVVNSLAVVLCLSPFISLIIALLVPTAPGYLLPMSLIQAALFLAGRRLCDRSLGEPPLSTALTPAGAAFVVIACLWGCLLRLTGGQVSWKQRQYGGPTGVR